MEREEEDAHPPGTHLAASWRLKYEVSAGIDYYVSTIPGADKRFLEFLSMLKQQSREQSRNAETHGVFSLSLALLCSCCCPLPTKLANYISWPETPYAGTRCIGYSSCEGGKLPYIYILR